MIRCRIKELMEARGIKKPRISLLVRLGISRKLAQKYLDGTKTYIHFRHIEIFCRLLNCEPSDLFVWEQGNGLPLADNHPLHKIKPRKVFILEEAVKNLSPAEIEKKFTQ